MGFGPTQGPCSSVGPPTIHTMGFPAVHSIFSGFLAIYNLHEYVTMGQSCHKVFLQEIFKARVKAKEKKCP
jgi:hypothetical protein